jgi:ubiquinone biosynthesis protein UbiJ
LEKRKLRQAKLLSRAYGDVQSAEESQAHSSSSAGLSQPADQAEAVFDDWLTGDLNWSWLPTGNAFAQSTDPNIQAFTLS